jgi:hypothetical protein
LWAQIQRLEVENYNLRAALVPGLNEGTGHVLH